jgi:hypothetical protein
MRMKIPPPFTFVLPTGRIGSHQWVTMVGADIL